MKSKVTLITHGKQEGVAVPRSKREGFSLREIFIRGLIATNGSQLAATRRAGVSIKTAKEWTRDLALGAGPEKRAA